MTLRNGNSLYILVLFGEAIGTAAVSLVPVPIEVTVRTGTVSLLLFLSGKLSGEVLFLSRKLSSEVFLVPFEEAI